MWHFPQFEDEIEYVWEKLLRRMYVPRRDEIMGEWRKLREEL
jgi:hypothetical protein